jgi:hypothetical protein
MNRSISLAALAALAVLSTAALADPVKDVDPKLHPNLAAAQSLVVDAFDKLKAAQSANEFDMSGHAQKAKEMLDKVNEQIKQAAQAANKAKK